MKRQRTLSGLLIIGTLLIAGAALWRSQSEPVPPAARQRSGPELRQSWRPASDPERKAAVAAIRSQLQAFRKGDYRQAVTYQSAGLKQRFKSVSQFRQMMQTSYPQFIRHRSVNFGPARCDPRGQRLEILVSVTGQDGMTRRAAYLMIREDSEFRVEGVVGGDELRSAPTVKA